MPKKKQAKVIITDVNLDRQPPLARAREVVSGGALTISLNIGRNTTMPKVGEIWWVQNLGTRWALYALVSDGTAETTANPVTTPELDLFFQVREQATYLSYYPLVKFNSAKVSGDIANVSHYIVSWTKCTKNGSTVRGEKAQQYIWNPNETTDGTDEFVDVGPDEVYDYAVEVPLAIDNPKTSYYKARIRAVAKGDSTKGAWSEWTKPKIPIRNSLNGPPPVDELELNFEAKETNTGKLDYRAIVSFKDIGFWDIPGYDFEDDVASYDVQLQPMQKMFETYGTVDGSFGKNANDFYVVETAVAPTTLPSSLSTPFDIQIGNEIIGISSRSGTKAHRKYNVAARGKYSTLAVGHMDEAAVKAYDINAYDDYNNLVPISPDTIPSLKEIVTNDKKDDVTDIDQDDTVKSWPRLGKINTAINAGKTQFNVTVSNEKLLRNVPKVLSPFTAATYLFKIVVRAEVMGVTDWSYNTTTNVLSLTVVRGIDDTQKDDHRDNAKVRINSWMPVGYLQEDVTEESDFILVVEDRYLDFDSNNNGVDENYTIRVNNEKMQVYSRALKDEFTYENKTYYVYEYSVYRAIQNTDSDAHMGGSDSVVELDLGYYYFAAFETIPQPTKLYWRARVRAQDRFNRFGPWSDWTDAVRASEDADDLAPAPTGVALNFKRKHRNREWSINVEVSWDKVSYEIPGGDTVEDVKGYQSRVLSSDGSKLAEAVGNDTYKVVSRYLTDNIAYLVLEDATGFSTLTEYSFSAGQKFEVNVTTTGREDIDEVYNGVHRVLAFDLENSTVAFYKEMSNLDLEETVGDITTPQTVIKVYEPDKTNSTQRQLGTDGIGYILLTSHDLPDGITLADAENKDYYEMMYVKDSWEAEDHYAYFVARGVLGTKPRNFATQWMISDVTEPIKPALIFTYPATFEATKVVDTDAQELEPYGGLRYTQVYGPVRRQFWYLGQVRTLDTYNRVGDWSIPSSPATALDNVRPPQPYNINVIPYTNYVKVDWDIQAEPGVFNQVMDLDQDGELDPDDFEIISSDVSYFKVQLWSEDPHAEAPDEQEAFGLSGDPVYSSGIVTLTTDQVHTFTAGETVVVKGCWPTGINGAHEVVSVPTATQINIAVTLSGSEPPYQIDGMVYKQGELQALDLYKQYPIHFFRRNSLDDLKSISLAVKGDICQIVGTSDSKGFYELINPNYRLLSNWKKIKKERVQIPGLLFYDRYVNLTSRNVPVKKLTNKVWARVCSVDEAGNQSEWISAGPFNTEFIPGPEWVLTKLIHQNTSQLDAKVQWAEVTSPDFTVGSYNIELQGGRLYAQLYGDSMDFWGLDPAQDVVVGMLSNGVTAETTDTIINITEFGDSADEGEFIKIGDELMRITHREASDDINGFIDAVYTVERGAVNTTPTLHDTGALILKVQSEAIIVRELFTPTDTASITNNESFQIVIGNERMVVLDRVAYDPQNDYGVGYGSTSPTTDPTGTWQSAGATGIGTVGSSFSTQAGSSSIIYRDGVWVAATATGIWTTSDLTTWTQRSTTTNLRSLTTDGTKWVAVGNGGTILTSTDPVGTWTASSQTPFGTDDIYSVKYGNGVWVIAGENNKIAYSYNPTSTWTLVDPNLFVVIDVFDKSITSNVAKITVAQNSNLASVSKITVSNLGAPFDGTFDNFTTTDVTLTLAGGQTFAATEITYSVTAADVASFGTLASPPVSLGLVQYDLNLNSIAYGAGYWAIVGNEGLLATTSNPAGLWTRRTVPTQLKLNSVVYANGYWVAVGNDGTILTATNPTLTWTNRTSGLIQDLFDVSYGASKWVAVGESGKIVTASNPTSTWTTATNGSSTNLYSVAFGSGATTAEWITAGTSGFVAYPGASDLDEINGNIWIYLVLRDRTWGSELAQVEDFEHPDLTPIFDSITAKTAIREGAAQADRDANDYWNYIFTNVPSTLYYRSRVQGVLKSGIKGNWSHYTLWANPNDLTAPPTPLVNADFDAKILDVSWIMPNDTTTQVFRVDNFDEVLQLSTARVGDIAVYTTVAGEITTVNAYRLTALPASDSANWQVTLSPIDDEGNAINVANDYLYKADAAAFYQVQVARIPKKWEAAGSLGRTLENINDASPGEEWDFAMDPGQKLDKYPKAGDRIKVGPGPSIKVTTLKNGLNEVQQIQLLRGATGNFKLTFRGATTGNIVYNASASTVQTALRSLSTIPANGVTVTKPKSTAWNVKFTGSLATQTNIPQMVPNDDGLNPAYGNNEIMTLIEPVPDDAEGWQKPQITLHVNRGGATYYHSKGALVQWMTQDEETFYDPKKPFAYRWLWKDDRFVTEMSKTYMADNIKDYLYVVRVRAADAAGNFSSWETEFVSPSGVPTPDVEDLEFEDIDNTPDTLEGILTFIGSMDVSENISTFVTELMPTQQMRLLNSLDASGTNVYLKRKKKVLNPATIGDYLAYIEDEIVLVTARQEATYQGTQAYKLTVERGYGGTTAVAHEKSNWFQWFHHFSVKQIIDGLPYTPSLDATVDADSGTVISSTPPATGRYKTIFHGIKAGRWYMGRAKAVAEDGKSSSWSDWSQALRGENGASLSGETGTVANPNPVRNLILDVDESKAHVSWLAPKEVEIESNIESIGITDITRVNTTATVITASEHGFSAGDAETEADTVTISGAFAPFNGTFTVTSVPDASTFTVEVDVTDNSPEIYPIEGQPETAVVTLATESANENTEIDHYEVWYAKGKYNGTTLLTTLAKLYSGPDDGGVEFPKPYIYKNLNVPAGDTVLTFPLPQSPGNYKYFVKVVAVNGAGKKSNPKYASGDVIHPPKPTIGEIKITALKGTRRCKAGVQILQPAPVADMDRLDHYVLQWFKTKDATPDFDNIQGIITRKPDKAFANHPTKKFLITGSGGLPRKWFIFVRMRAVNKGGNKSQWTTWKRKKIITKSQ